MKPELSICRLCGERSMSARPERREWFFYRHHAETQESLCEGHLREFDRWARQWSKPRPEFDSLVDLTTFNIWIARVLTKLSRVVQGGCLQRCHYIHDGERCIRFATSSWRGHHVCGIHKGTLRNPKTDLAKIAFDSRRSITAFNVEKAVRVLMNKESV